MPVIYSKDGIFDAYQRSIIDTWLAPLTGDDIVTITRGHSLPIDQLHTIAKMAKDEGIAFKEFDPENVSGHATIFYDNKTLDAYTWWQTWLELIHRKYRVNPPLATPTPFAFNAHQAGDIIPASPHIKPMPKDENEDPAIWRCPIDISQLINRGMATQRADLLHIVALSRKAKDNGAPILNITVEPTNGCVHWDLLKKAA